jgi:hypothetical protein
MHQRPIGSRVGWTVLFIAILCASLATSKPSIGYNHDGHFYTAAVLENDRVPAFAGIERDEAILIAFCTQLPDLAEDLDAITLRAKEIPSIPGTLWGGFGVCLGPGVRRMATVHQYVHALTGSAAQNVTDAAVDLIKTLRAGRIAGTFDPKRACAIGLGLHLLGDSFAHRRLDRPDRTYPPGLGHFRDGHDPDYLELRPALWRRYAGTMADALDLNIDPAHWSALDAMQQSNAGKADEDNGFQTTQIVADLKTLLGSNAQSWAGYSPPVEQLGKNDGLIAQYILDKSFDDIVTKDYPQLQSHGRFTFDEVWGLYLPEAVAAFKRHGVSTLCDPS